VAERRVSKIIASVDFKVWVVQALDDGDRALLLDLPDARRLNMTDTVVLYSRRVNTALARELTRERSVDAKVSLN
jgi:hypothetical protein